MRMTRAGRAPAVLGALAFSLAASVPALAQPAASQHGAVSQVVNTTTISLGYDRPVLRGRTLFKDVLQYDTEWTPGANTSTWIDVSEPVRIQGRALPAGRYGVWAVPHRDAPWEFVFLSEWNTMHTIFLGNFEVLRVEATPESGAHMETLAFYFPVVGPYETTLRLHWGEIVVPLRIEVPR